MFMKQVKVPLPDVAAGTDDPGVMAIGMEAVLHSRRPTAIIR
jgi:hypothetical protein